MIICGDPSGLKAFVNIEYMPIAKMLRSLVKLTIFLSVFGRYVAVTRSL